MEETYSSETFEHTTTLHDAITRNADRHTGIPYFILNNCKRSRLWNFTSSCLVKLRYHAVIQLRYLVLVRDSKKCWKPVQKVKRRPSKKGTFSLETGDMFWDETFRLAGFCNPANVTEVTEGKRNTHWGLLIRYCSCVKVTGRVFARTSLRVIQFKIKVTNQTKLKVI
jgi:hypothetical protein